MRIISRLPVVSADGLTAKGVIVNIRKGRKSRLWNALVNRVKQDEHVILIALWDEQVGDAADGVDDFYPPRSTAGFR